MPDRSDISPLSITDSKISNEARIAHAKLAKATEGQILVAQSNGKFAAKTLSGDVTLTSNGSTTSSVVTTSDGTTVVTGPQGAKGEKGNKGDTGSQGTVGPSGSDATVTAENVDGALGFSGSTAGLVKRTADNTFALDTATYETSFSKNTAFNKNFGAATGDVCQGDDGRLSDARTPATHASTHATGAADAIAPSDIGAEPSFSKNTAHNKNFGTAASTVCQGDDSRLSDTRTPSSTLVHKSTHETGQSDALSPSDIGAETAFSKNTAFNKNFGAATGDVCQGDDSRLSDTRTPSSTLAHKSSHETGESDALSPSDIGAESAFSKNTAHNKNFGTATGTVCQGDDSRLSDTRTPSAHNHSGTDITSGTIDTDRLDVGASSGKVAAGDHAHASYITGNQSITLSGDVTGSGTTAITCVVGNDSHTHSTSTLTGLGGAAEKDVGTGSGDVAQGNHTHAAGTTSAAGFISTTDKTKLDACLEVDDTSSAATNTWSAEKIAAIINDGTSSFTNAWSSSKVISYLATFYATLSNGFSNHKYTAAIQWERTLAISSTGWAQGSGSGAWQANQTYASLAQTSTSGSGEVALFNVGVDTSGVPTFTWVSGGGGYAVDDMLTFTDPGITTSTCAVTVTAVATISTGISFSGTTGSMTCNINHDLGTEYITMSVRDKDDVIEDLGHIPIVTVIDADNVKLEYGASDYPDDVGEYKFITIIG